MAIDRVWRQEASSTRTDGGGDALAQARREFDARIVNASKGPSRTERRGRRHPDPTAASSTPELAPAQQAKNGNDPRRPEELENSAEAAHASMVAKKVNASNGPTRHERNNNRGGALGRGPVGAR